MNFNRNLLSDAVRLGLAAGAVGLLGLVSAPAFAQDSEDDASTLDRIEVTGSRIKRADIEGATPVVVIDRQAIDASGDITVADLMRDATFASFGNFKPQSGSSGQALASIDLRGLGSGRTLVLIDGRRAPTTPVSASSGSDLNAIPLAAVERIEILSDGASAIYGSDAIGGVVNIITRKDFNGAELRYGIGRPTTKGGDLEDASAIFGAASDRTHMIGGVSKSSRGMVYTRDQIGGDGLGVSTYGNNFYDWDTGAIRAVPGFDCTQGAFYMLSNGRCSFNFNSVAANEAKVSNKSIFVRADHQINDDWLVYFNASSTKVETFGRYAPVPGVVVASDGTPNDIVQGDGLPTYFFHRFAAAGNRDNFTDTNNSDFLLGFQGQLTDTISTEFGIRRTDYKYIELGRGYIVSAIANQFVDQGLYDLTNPYGADPAVLAGMTATINRESRWQTDEVFANVGFDLFELTGGTSSAVVGGEYRSNDYIDLYDSLSEGGQVLGSAGNSSAGQRSQRAAYFEWFMPFFSNFDVTVAGRFDDYSDYGNDFSPKVSFRWQPMDDLTLRGSYGEGFRAPGLDILTQKPTFSAEPINNDPQSCINEGLDADCNNLATGRPSSIQVDTTFVANPDLGSENSKQFSLGAVYSPIDWLDLSLDYYNIEITNLIGQISPGDIINSDLHPEIYGPIPAGLSLTRRANGSIASIVAGYANRGKLKTDGFDFRANTDFDLGDWGQVRNQLSISRVSKYEIQDAEGGYTDYIDLEGQPQVRANLQNQWAYGDFTLDFNSNYIAGQHGGGANIGGYTTHDVQVSWAAPWNARIAVGATNVGDRYPQLDSYDGRPWNFYLYDAAGRVPYVRYTQNF